MPTPSTAVWPKPRSEDEFEEIAVDSLRIRWRDPNAQRFGRRGQRQHGVDIVGHPPRLSGAAAGGQCKNTPSLALADVMAEVDKAKTFPGGLAEFYVVTSGDRDAKLQARVLKHFAAHPAPFLVALLFWEDLTADLSTDELLVAKHWKGFARETPSASSAPNEVTGARDDEERMTDARHRYPGALIDVFMDLTSREEFEQLLGRAGHSQILDEVAENTSYSALARFTVTRAIVGGWLSDLLRAAPERIAADPRILALQGAVPMSAVAPGQRRRRIAMLLQHMARLEGQQVQTPGYLWIAHGHETGVKASADDDSNDELLGYMAAIDLESIRDHLHDVLETTLGLISELDSDTVIAEEVPEAYMALMRGMNARARILRHALKHGTTERASDDYRELIQERDAAVRLLLDRLSEHG